MPNLRKKLKIEDKKSKKIWVILTKVVMRNFTMMKQLLRSKLKKKERKNRNIWPTNQKIQIMHLKHLLTQIQKAKLGKTDKECYLLVKEVLMVDIDI
jgi:hypothetical protein